MGLGDYLGDRLAAPPLGSLAASRLGIQRMSGMRSTAPVTHHTFLAPAQLVPNALTEPFSAKGVTRFILIGELSMEGGACQKQHRTLRTPHAAMPNRNQQRGYSAVQ